MEEQGKVEKTADELWEQVQQDRATGAAKEEFVPKANQENQADDPFGALPEPTRKLIQDMQDRAKKSDDQIALLDKKLGTANGIIGNLKQWHDESQAKLKEVEPLITESIALKKAEAEAKAAEREQKRMAAREAITELSPELAEYVDIVVSDIKPKEEAKKPTESKPQNNVEEELRILRLENALSIKSPGWQTIKETPEFKSWMSSQPADYQKAKYASWDVDEVSSAFSDFAKHKVASTQIAQLEEERRKRLDRGGSIQGRGSSVGNVDLSADAAWEKVKRDREKSRTQI